jgi:hypothetical protein
MHSFPCVAGRDYYKPQNKILILTNVVTFTIDNGVVLHCSYFYEWNHNESYSILFYLSFIISISFHYFLVYFPYLFTIQLGFLPYFSYLFTIHLAFLPYYPYLITIQSAFLKYGRKVRWNVKRYGKCGRKVRWNVKWYGKYGRKASRIVIRYGQ